MAISSRKSEARLVRNRLRKFLLPGILVNRKVRLTALGWLYNGLVLLFGFAAINTQNNLLYLIVAVMIGMMLASFWLSEMNLTEIELGRELPETVVRGEAFMLVYRLRNLRRFWPCAGLELVEQVGEEQVRVYFSMVRSGAEETAYAHVILNRRGKFELKELLVQTYFPFGLFEKSKKVHLPGRLTVLPSPVFGERETAFGAALSGASHSGQKGVGSELFGFRQYSPGDHPHWINWKASARSSQLLVEETEHESEQALVISLLVSGLRPEFDDPGREALIDRAFGLARSYLEQGYRVRLELLDRGIDFGTGPKHLQKLGLFLAMFDDPQEPCPGEELRPFQFPAQKIALG